MKPAGHFSRWKLIRFYVTMLYESGIDPLVAMRIVGHADYQTTANIYTHLKDETLRRAYISMEKVFGENQA